GDGRLDRFDPAWRGDWAGPPRLAVLGAGRGAGRPYPGRTHAARTGDGPRAVRLVGNARPPDRTSPRRRFDFRGPAGGGALGDAHGPHLPHGAGDVADAAAAPADRGGRGNRGTGGGRRLCPVVLDRGASVC